MANEQDGRLIFFPIWARPTLEFPMESKQYERIMAKAYSAHKSKNLFSLIGTCYLLCAAGLVFEFENFKNPET